MTTQTPRRTNTHDTPKRSHLRFLPLSAACALVVVAFGQGGIAPVLAEVQAAGACSAFNVVTLGTLPAEAQVFGEDTVLRGDDLTIAGLLITEGGSVATGAGMPNRGADLCLEAETITVLSGAVLCTGSGVNGDPAEGESATGEGGSRGGNLIIVLIDDPHTIQAPAFTAMPGSVLCTGNGGDGGDGKGWTPNIDWVDNLPCIRAGGSALLDVKGGNGGDAGSFRVVDSGSSALSVGPGSMALGAGGRGGNALAFSDGARDYSTLSGSGGDSRAFRNEDNLGKNNVDWFSSSRGGDAGDAMSIAVKCKPADDCRSPPCLPDLYGPNGDPDTQTGESKVDGLPGENGQPGFGESWDFDGSCSSVKADRGCTVDSDGCETAVHATDGQVGGPGLLAGSADSQGDAGGYGVRLGGMGGSATSNAGTGGGGGAGGHGGEGQGGEAWPCNADAAPGHGAHGLDGGDSSSGTARGGAGGPSEQKGGRGGDATSNEAMMGRGGLGGKGGTGNDYPHGDYGCGGFRGGMGTMSAEPGVGGIVTTPNGQDGEDGSDTENEVPLTTYVPYQANHGSFGNDPGC